MRAFHGLPRREPVPTLPAGPEPEMQRALRLVAARRAPLAATVARLAEVDQAVVDRIRSTGLVRIETIDVLGGAETVLVLTRAGRDAAGGRS